ncbi:MAG TPA: hypothetical protein VFO00_07790, partial [Vitreimonas sp.]|nr:hypothetical protein [Vitreimonas sp.]
MLVRHFLSATLIALAACATPNQQGGSGTAPAERVFAGPPLSEAALLEHIRILASDEFEGRAPGTNGERLTLDYLERAFAAAGLQPGLALPDGTRSWRQEVPLTAATLTNTPTLTFAGRDGAREYAYATQFSAWTRRLDPTVDI